MLAFGSTINWYRRTAALPLFRAKVNVLFNVFMVYGQCHEWASFYISSGIADAIYISDTVKTIATVIILFLPATGKKYK